MIKYFIVMLSLPMSLFAQQGDSLSQNKEKVFVFVEQSPDFVGGQEALYQFLAKNLKYPNEARKAGTEGKVHVQFVIEPDGSVTNPQIVKGVSKELDEEAIRVVSKMPKWRPGKQWGKNVRTQFVLPLTFKVSQK